jgi:FOG: HEAT repeat
MKLLDFDKRFADFTSQWMKEHKDDYKNFDAMEQDMPNVYMQFLNTPATWLSGVTPGAYFTQFDDCKELVDWMVAYTDKRVPIPAQLLDRIVEVGIPCEKRLVLLLKDSSVNMEARMTAIGLLREMESMAPRSLYIDWTKNRVEKDELCDNALESLHQMGKEVVKQLTEVIGGATQAGQEAILDVLCNYPGNDKVLKIALELFEKNKKKRAVLASYLGKLGDERALPVLCEAAQDEKLPYLDFIEIRNAIERLGGDAPDRQYEDDDGYTAMQRMQ